MYSVESQRLDTHHQRFAKYISKLFFNRGKFVSLHFLLELIFFSFSPYNAILMSHKMYAGK